MDLLRTLGLKKKKSRSERLKENMSDVVHTVADTLDELVTDTRKGAPKVAHKAEKAVKEARKEAPKVAKKASKKLKKARKEAGHLTEEVSDQASTLASELRDRTETPRAEATERLGQAADAAGAKSAAVLAALGALTANWDDVAHSLVEELGKAGNEAEKRVEHKKQELAERKPKKKEKGYPGFFVWLLRLGIGVWFVQRLRGRDIAAFIDHGAGDRLRAAKEHPVQSYRDILNGYLLPNASLVGMGIVGAEALTALGYITGLNRRMAALAGLLVTSNDFMLNYEDEEKKGQDLALLLAQLLLLRTGG